MPGYDGRDHGSHIELYVHVVWTTGNREPVLTEAISRTVFACIVAECRLLRVEVLALNGVEDHVHLLVRVPSSMTVAAVAKQVKGASSHLATHRLGSEGFKWQEGYAAFTVSRWDVPKLVGYIERQQEHHHENATKPLLEPR